LERDIIQKLAIWKDSYNRKPLIIKGARQVGKSWAVQEFAKKFITGRLHLVNFEENTSFSQVFESNFDITRIIRELEVILGQTIGEREDLIFFDEIQVCPKAIIALRYFYEKMPNMHIICAGSLLDFVLKDISFPVGRVEELEMHPLTFKEYLLARGKIKLLEILSQRPIHESEAFDQEMQKELQLYFVIGGMPECVNTYINTNSLVEVMRIQNQLINTYRNDFRKYTPRVNPDCLNDILASVSNRIGQQIKYTTLSDRFTSVTVKSGIEVLNASRLLYTVTNVNLNGMPLIPQGKQFKLIFLDIGLLVRLSGLPIQADLISGNLLTSFKGTLAEQFIGQELKAHAATPLHYWENTNPGTMAEIDYVIEQNGKIIPIEIKYGKSGSLKSLHSVLDRFSKIEQAYVFSNAHEGRLDKINFLTLYYVYELYK
jgi:uncharacterized protein